MQTKRDTPVLREQGVGRAAGDRILEKFTVLRKLKRIIPVDVKKGRLKREKDYDLGMKVGSRNVRTMLPRLRWLDQVEEDLKKMKARHWREV